MKNINHNYWEGCHEKYKGDADCHNPDLRVAMNQLYGKINGEKVFDFGVIKKDGGTAEYKDEKNIQFNCSPDGYSTYTTAGKYKTSMPFKEETVAKHPELVNKIRALAGTIAGEFFFPCCKVNGNTINQDRGFGKIGQFIGDRIDLTLRDIKKYYDKEQGDYPLKDTLCRYSDFFDKFGGFDKYVDHCLLGDFCDENYKVSLWKDKDGLPATSDELIGFWEWSLKKLNLRLARIEKFAHAHNLFDQE